MMNDESIARKIREIALSLENWRVEFFRKCDPNSYYAEEKSLWIILYTNFSGK